LFVKCSIFKEKGYIVSTVNEIVIPGVLHNKKSTQNTQNTHYIQQIAFFGNTLSNNCYSIKT